MKLPTATEYQAALQDPRLALTDSDLMQCEVELNGWGIPRPRSGGFVLTFHLFRRLHDYAVRCFHRDVAHLAAKYDAIGRCLRSDSTGLFQEFEYQPSGIRVSGNLYPIIKMAWVRGDTLGSWVESNLGHKDKLRAFFDNFSRAIRDLSTAGLAHGDLQHGNIMVDADAAVHLIDYDGLFVPGMRPGDGHEIGHVNFQHPQRNPSHFGPSMDRFSALVIATSLELLIADPSLWNGDFNTGDNLLFTGADFRAPDASRLFQRASGLPGAAGQLSQRLRAVAGASIDLVPTLEDFLQGRSMPQASAPTIAPAPKRQHDVLQATDRDGLLRREGDMVEVEGVVYRVGETSDRRGDEIGFLNFAGRWDNGFTVVLWPRVLAEVCRRLNDSSLSSLKGKSVSVLGLIEQYKGSPQIALEDSAHLRVVVRSLTNREKIDQWVSGPGSMTLPYSPGPRQPSPPQHPGPLTNREKIDQWVSGPDPKTPQHPIAPRPPPPPASSTLATKDNTIPWICAIVGGLLGTLVLPVVLTAAGACLGWWVGVELRDRSAKP